ncbi:MAG TPA: DUF3108 domain-containing protein [Tangfeifania sp.]|nr:DUF3108 domain-containing protein [Tangfeifania sp.]
MKKYLIAALLAFLLTQTVSAKKERILFNLKFGFVKGGEAVLNINDTLFQSQPAIHYYLEVRTTGLTDKLFGVNDIYESIVDAQTRLPLKSVRNIKEGKYRWYNETLFFHDKDSLLSQKSGWRPAPENLVDIVSVFFYFINNHLMENIEKGEKVSLPTFHADKIDTVSVQYQGDRMIKSDLGEIDTYVLAPTVDKGKLLNRSDGLKFFISKESKLPVLLEFDMRVGALRAILQSYEIDGEEQVSK